MKLAMFFKIVIILICLLQQESFAQLPKIIPPPAEAANLGKYGDIPVDLSSGIVNVNIPITTVHTNKLSFPISLDYMANGVKVDQMSGPVGLGWNLNCGGVITRTIRGIDDFTNNRGYFNTTIRVDPNLINSYDWNVMDQISNGDIDTEPDYFYFNFLNYSGKFCFDSLRTPTIIDYKNPIVIKFNPQGNNFTVIDGVGNTYSFNQKDTTDFIAYYQGNPVGTHQIYTSSWYLSKVVSFDRTDSIIFTYHKESPLYQNSYSYSEGVGPSYDCSGNGTSGPNYLGVKHDGQGVISSQTTMVSNPLRLERLTTTNCSVYFYNSSGRMDNDGTKLDSIVVKQNLSPFLTINKTIMHYSYFVSNTIPLANSPLGYRLRLDSTNFIADNKASTYKLEYESTPLPPINSLSRDLFNYYNGANNTTLIPQQNYVYSFQTYAVGGGNRDGNFNFMKAGILSKIIYPTGGYTLFNYEPNKIQMLNEGTSQLNNASFMAMARGISDVQMGSHGERDTVLFQVTNKMGQFSLSVNMTRFNYNNVYDRPLVSLENLTDNQTIFVFGNSDINNGYSYNGSLPVGTSIVPGKTYRLIANAFDNPSVTATISVNYVYDTVITPTTLTAKLYGGLRINQIASYDINNKLLKKNEYKYGINEDGFGSLPSSYYLLNTFHNTVNYYLGCSATIGCAGQNYSREMFYSNSLYDGFMFVPSPISYPMVTQYSVDSMNGQSYKTVSEYSSYQNGVLPVPLNNENLGIIITNAGYEGGKLLKQTEFATNQGGYLPIRRVLYNYDSSILKINNVTKVSRNVSATGCYIEGNQSPIQHIAYNMPLRFGSVLPRSQTEITFSQQDTMKTFTKRTDQYYNNKIALIPNKTVETQSNGKVKSTINLFALDSIDLNYPSGDLETSRSFFSTNHNINTILQSKISVDNISIEELKNSYIVTGAQCLLKQTDNIKGNTISSILFNQYDTYGNIQEQQKIGDVKEVYLWGYNGQYPVVKVVGSDLSTVLGIVSQLSINNATNNSYTSTTDGSLRTLLASLRTGLPSAQVWTYTYKPLVGMTSETDPKGYTTFYEYDGFGRLQYAKDKDGNILKSYDYHYQNQ